jgi:GGDEF domain-containing protein
VCIQALVRLRKATSKVQRSWFGTFMEFAIIPTCSIVVDLFVPNTPVIALGALTAILFVFSSLQEARIFNDSLTGLNNRRRADMYLTDKIASVGKAGAVYVYVLDINLFKQINDTRGHMEGDHALQVVANGLRDAAGKSRGFVARWGGDEFVLVVDASATASPDEVVDVIDKSLVLA